MAKLPTLLPAALRDLFRKPATRRYPAREREPFAHARGAVANDPAKCILCGLCARACPTHCIEVDRDAKLWAHDPFACIQCGVCAEVCPTKSLVQNEERHPLLLERQRTELHPDPPKKRKPGEKKK